MGIGVGMGEVIEIFELIKQVRTRFVNAPSQYNDISEDGKNFSDIVREIEARLSGFEPESRLRAILKSIVDDSSDLSNDVLGRLKKDEVIGKPSTGITGCMKKAWVKLNWKSDDAQQMRNRMLFNIALLSLTEGQRSSEISSMILQQTTHLFKQSIIKECDDVLEWIGTFDYSSRHRQMLEQHQEGTAEWVLESDKFRTWIKTKEQVLLCRGPQGAGKSIIASIVVEHLEKSFSNERDVGIAYHYCDDRDPNSQDHRVILASILKQLTQCLNPVPNTVANLYKRRRAKGARPLFKEVATMLSSVASLCSRVYIVVDGLDECSGNEGTTVLAKLRSLQGANVLVTSRDIPNVVDNKILEGSSVLEIRADDADIRKYLNHNMSNFYSFVWKNQQLQQHICSAIVASAGGMSLLADLQLKSLQHELSEETLKNELKILPSGSSAYDAAYLNTMKRIERQMPNQIAIGKSTLTWLTFAKRPLQVEELRTAVVLKESDSNITQERLIDINDMISLCAGLVNIEKSSQKVSIKHKTALEYLDRTLYKWRPDADAAIATACLTYLLFPSFDVDFSELEGDSAIGRADMQADPLLAYAQEYGAIHARTALSKPPSIARFFSSSSRMPKNWLLSSTKYGGAQAEATAEWLIEGGVCIEIWDEARRSPLHYAARNGWKRCVELLLQRKASLDPDVDYMTPFHYAVQSCQEKTVQAFLDAGIPVDTAVTRERFPAHRKGGVVFWTVRDGVQNPIQEADKGKGLTGLHLAVLTCNGHMTKFLLDHGANPNFPSDAGETPLHIAIRKSLYDLTSPGLHDFWNHPKNDIEIALEELKDLETEEQFYSAQASVERDRLTIISLLLDNSMVDVNCQDVLGISPLYIAAGQEDPNFAFQKLIDKGAKISVRTIRGETPLHCACRNKNAHAATALLNLGADPMDSDVDGVNALHYAAKSGHLEVMQSVVNHVSGTAREGLLTSRDNHGQNILHHLKKGEAPDATTLVKGVLQWPVGINDLNDAGMSPMATIFTVSKLCSSHEIPEVLRLMFEYGANPSFRTGTGQGLAHLSAGSRRVSASILQALENGGVDLRAEDNHGQTALHYSVIKRTVTEDVLNFLCGKIGLSPHLRDEHGKTPLDYAVVTGHKGPSRLTYSAGEWKQAKKLLLQLGEACVR